MAAERITQCLLGNGDCPTDCRLYEGASKITQELGEDFDPVKSRRTIMFMDTKPGVTVVQVAAMISRCKKEPPDLNFSV